MVNMFNTGKGYQGCKCHITIFFFFFGLGLLMLASPCPFQDMAYLEGKENMAYIAVKIICKSILAFAQLVVIFCACMSTWRYNTYTYMFVPYSIINIFQFFGFSGA